MAVERIEEGTLGNFVIGSPKKYRLDAKGLEDQKNKAEEFFRKIGVLKDEETLDTLKEKAPEKYKKYIGIVE